MKSPTVRNPAGSLENNNIPHGKHQATVTEALLRRLGLRGRHLALLVTIGLGVLSAVLYLTMFQYDTELRAFAAATQHGQMVGIRNAYGNVGTDFYVSLVFVVVLGIVGSIVLRDALRSQNPAFHKSRGLPPLARWVRTIHIPGTMMRFKSMDNASVSVVIIAPLGFATGLLAASIAVGGFIGVPAMMYVLGVPAMMASATELVIAFVMGTGGSLLYAWEGVVDIRLAMIILTGSLFGIQIGAIGTTYVKEYTVKIVMALIMLIVLLSRLIKLPVYLADINMIAPITDSLREVLNVLSTATLGLALLSGAGAILVALFRGIALHKRRHALGPEVAAD
jgi:hypothetical protein